MGTRRRPLKSIWSLSKALSIRISDNSTVQSAVHPRAIRVSSHARTHKPAMAIAAVSPVSKLVIATYATVNSTFL